MLEKLIELNKFRQKDVLTIVEIRNKKKYNWSQLEIRNTLFIYAVCCSHLDYDEAVKKLDHLRGQLLCQSESYYKSLLKNLKMYCSYFRFVNKCRYQFTNKKLIDLLNISNNEMTYLDSIISDEEKAKRENILIDEELERIRIENQIEESIQKNQIEESIQKYNEEMQELGQEAIEEISDEFPSLSFKKIFKNIESQQESGQEQASFNDSLDDLIFGYRDPFLDVDM